MDFACVIDPQYWPHGELPEQFKLDFETHQWRRFAEPGEYYGGVVDWRAVVVRCVVRLPVEICLSSLVVSGGDCGGRGRTNVRNFCHPQWRVLRGMFTIYPTIVASIWGIDIMGSTWGHLWLRQHLGRSFFDVLWTQCRFVF